MVYVSNLCKVKFEISESALSDGFGTKGGIMRLRAALALNWVAFLCSSSSWVWSHIKIMGKDRKGFSIESEKHLIQALLPLGQSGFHPLVNRHPEIQNLVLEKSAEKSSHLLKWFSLGERHLLALWQPWVRAKFISCIINMITWSKVREGQLVTFMGVII